MKILTNRRQLKEKKSRHYERYHLAKRLKKVKEKSTVESAWFVNGNIRYKTREKSTVRELRSWDDIWNIQ